MPPLPSALVDIPNGSVTSPRGFTAAAAHAGLKADGAPDVALLVGATSCATAGVFTKRSEEHTSELQSRLHLVCRLLLEKKKKTKQNTKTQKKLQITHED